MQHSAGRAAAGGGGGGGDVRVMDVVCVCAVRCCGV